MEKHIDLDNETVDAENETMSRDMEKLLAILHNIPEVEIPDRFEQRFNEALKAEGGRIREEKLTIGTNKKRKWHLKAMATAAACFVVVFASVSMYNDGIGPGAGRNLSEESADAPISLSADMSDAEAEKRLASDSGNGSENIAEKENSNQWTGQPLVTNQAEPQEDRVSDGNGQDSVEAEIYYGIQGTGTDNLILCREGSKYVEATEEYWAYRRLVDEYLIGYEFTVTGCERDSETGGYLFEVHIVTDPEGQIVDESLILRGEQGEIHDPENSTDEDEPQAGSD